MASRNGIALLFILPCIVCLARADILLTDDAGQLLRLSQPARRIVVLAPHLTDMLVALGASAGIAGVVDDHQTRGAHARSLSGFPVVADSASLNAERLLLLRPDVVLAWGGGTPQPWLARLRELGLPVFVMEAHHLDDLAGEIVLLGRMSGHEEEAGRQAAALRARLQSLRQRYSPGARLRFFYQVWPQPLYSLNAGHLLSQAFALCGADNIVPAGPVASPLINPEFVLAADPDVIVFPATSAVAARAFWSRFSGLRAARMQHWLAVDDRRLTRPGPDMLSAMEPVCAQLAQWRSGAAAKSR